MRKRITPRTQVLPPAQFGTYPMIHLSPEDRTVYARAIAVGAAGDFEWPSKQERGLMMTLGRATAGGVVNDDGTMAHELAHERRQRNLLAIAKQEEAGAWRQMPTAPHPAYYADIDQAALLRQSSSGSHHSPFHAASHSTLCPGHGHTHASNVAAGAEAARLSVLSQQALEQPIVREAHLHVRAAGRHGSSMSPDSCTFKKAGAADVDSVSARPVLRKAASSAGLQANTRGSSTINASASYVTPLSSPTSASVQMHIPQPAASPSLWQSRSSYAVGRPATAEAAAGSGTGGRLTPSPQPCNKTSPFVLGSTYCSYSHATAPLGLPRPSTASSGAGRTAIVSTSLTRRSTSQWHMSTYVPSISIPRGGSAGRRVPVVKGARSGVTRPGSAFP